MVIFINPSCTKNWIPCTNEESSMEPSALQPALFFIQTGISDVFDAIVGVFPALIIKEDMSTVDLEFPYWDLTIYYPSENFSFNSTV